MRMWYHAPPDKNHTFPFPFPFPFPPPRRRMLRTQTALATGPGKRLSKCPKKQQGKMLASLDDRSHHPSIPIHPYPPSIFTQFPSSTALSHPIMTASNRHPAALTVHTTTSLTSASTVRSIT